MVGQTWTSRSGGLDRLLICRRAGGGTIVVAISPSPRFHRGTSWLAVSPPRHFTHFIHFIQFTHFTHLHPSPAPLLSLPRRVSPSQPMPKCRNDRFPCPLRWQERTTNRPWKLAISMSTSPLVAHSFNWWRYPPGTVPWRSGVAWLSEARRADLGWR